MPTLNLNDAFQRIDREVCPIYNRFMDEAEHSVTSASLLQQLPTKLSNHLTNWHFGEYGWTSPTNLLITASWAKWLSPTQNVCRIWAEDALENPIDGGYSIRSYDEKVTVKIFGKYLMTKDFCSNNSGMQGSRALEKARDYQEIRPGLTIRQRVYFNMDLFVGILTGINSLTAEQAHICFLYFFYKGLEIAKNKRLQEQRAVSVLNSETAGAYSWIVRAIHTIKDPEFIRAVCGSLCSILWSSLTLNGIEDAKTSANARSQSPGDFWLTDDNQEPFVAVEVKAEGIQFSWKDLNNAIERLNHYPSCRLYICVTADNVALDPNISNNSSQMTKWISRVDDLKNQSDISFRVMTLRELALGVLIRPARSQAFFERLSQIVVKMPSLAHDTLNLLASLSK